MPAHPLGDTARMTQRPMIHVPAARFRPRAGSALIAFILLIGGLGLGVALAPAASAHTVLLNVQPADGATIASAPSQVVLTFNEPVQSSTLQLAVTNSAGATVSKEPPAVAGTVVTQALPALPNDTYTVAYRLVSVDGHPVTATTSFVLADPDATASAEPTSVGSSPDVLSTPAPAGAPGEGGGGIGWKIGAGAAILLILAMLYASVSHSRVRRAERAERRTTSPDQRYRG